MINNEIFQKQLIDRYVNNTAGPEELEVLDHLISEGKLEQLLLTHMEASWQADEAEFVPQGKPFKLWRQIAAAAVLLITLSAGLFFYLKDSGIGLDHQDLAKHDITAGVNKATLTLANGKSINLSDRQTGVVIEQGEVVYNDHSVVRDSLSSQELTAVTPRGGTYQVTLPDGTRVWLNAASTLKFPSTFAKLADRKVELLGEAYFEVAKDRQHPFIVKFGNQEVKVLGTHFNINSYAEERVSKTTLLEGRVQVSLNGKKQVVLKPGEQALAKAGVILVKPVDTEEAIAWKMGYFTFTRENLESIMLKVSRWYDLEVVYKDENLKTIPFSGSVPRFVKVSELLKTLELTGKVKFKFYGRKIEVRSN